MNKFYSNFREKPNMLASDSKTILIALLTNITALALPVVAHANTPNANYESVIGIDDRYAVDPNTYPYNAVARITYSTGDACSGWLSSADTLVTAGHCILDKTTGQNYSIRQVYPGYAGNMTSPLNGSCTVKKTYLYPEWANDNNAAFDIGIIKLDCSRKDLQPLSYAYLPNGIDFRGITLTISGYPGDKSNSESPWASQGKLLNYTGELLAYDNDTNGGMSGSPIWLDAGSGKPPLVIGIHTTGYTDSNGAGAINVGVHLSDRVIADIQAIEKLP